MARAAYNTMDPARLPSMLTTAQAAAVMEVHLKTVQKWARKGLLPAKKKGAKLWVIPKWAVMEYIEREAYAGGAT